MANDILGVSISGLKISQAALRTVGHNIANAGTDGYSRQRVDANTNPAAHLGGHYVGSGAHVNSIDRIVNQFVTDQMRTDTAMFSDLETYFDQISQLDSLLSNDSTGLAVSLNNFFAAMQNGADDPTSIPSRELIISEAQNLATRFNSIYDRLQIIDSGINTGMEAAVARINALTNNIAKLNLQIANAMGMSSRAQPNDLYDQRDLALKELASLVSIQVIDQGNGKLNVHIGTGQSLVLGDKSLPLELTNSTANPLEKEVVYFDGTRRIPITDVINSGKLGGLIRARDTMSSVYNELGKIAVTMADSFNKLNSQGVDLEGDFGGNFFYDVNDDQIARSRVINNGGNAKPDDRRLALYIDDSTKITSSDYEISFSQGGIYKITRLGDGVQVANGALNGKFPATIKFDGLELKFESGSFQAGDKFTLQPVRTGANDISVAVASPRDLAFASPLVTDAALGNRGTGTISAGELVSLKDANGNPLPLFAEAGTMSPPLIVVFNTPYSYDILDNSDPGNPVHLNPPIRDQRYVPGVTQNLFPQSIGGTQVSTNGEMMGLPDGRFAVTQAALLPGGTPPDFTVTDFSGANSFSFDVTVSGKANGAVTSYTLTIDGGDITDNESLLQHINGQLTNTDVRAYIADDGSLAFRMLTPGYGNITLENYSGGNQANNLFGFDIEGSTFTTEGNADGVAGYGMLTNGYPAEMVTITRPSTTPGAAPVSVNLFTPQNASAKELAGLLSSQPGVVANAFNYVELSDLQITRTEPLQISLNGEKLLEYSVEPVTGNPIIAATVPDPVTHPDEFYDYVAEQINNNPALQAKGIYAVAGADSVTGARELRIYSSEGDDFKISLTAAAGESIDVSDGENSPLTLTGAGSSVGSHIVVGGRLDISLDEGITLGTTPSDSMIFGDTKADDFALSTYLGIQASISGSPQAGDRFTLDFNRDAAMDNRNALKMIELQQTKMGKEGTTFNQSYGSLVEKVGIETSSAKINRNAAERVLQQTEDLRNSISGVNLDEEAADLIRFEQMFSANAQVISVARDIFDRLINSF